MLTSSSYSSLNYVKLLLSIFCSQKGISHSKDLELSILVLRCLGYILIRIPYSLSCATSPLWLSVCLSVLLAFILPAFCSCVCVCVVIKTLAKCRPHHYRFCFKLPLQPQALKRHARSRRSRRRILWSFGAGLTLF